MKSRLASRRASTGSQPKRLSAISSRYARGLQQTSYTATEAKNVFGRALDQAMQGATVVITKHDSPKAVLISIEQFNALSQAPQLKLDVLSKQFDALLARMQTPEARAGMQAAFDASPKQLGKAALATARKRA